MSAISKQLSACSIDLARPVSSPITLSLSSLCARNKLFLTPARCCSLKPQRPQRDFLDSCLTNHHAFLGVLCVFA